MLPLKRCLLALAITTLPLVSSAEAQVLKRGIGSSSGALNNALNSRWHYAWGQTPAAGATSEFVPMIWSGNNLANFNTAIQNVQNLTNVRYLLGFNEPERTDQANMTVATAIDRWGTIVNSFGTSIRLVSPAVSDNAAGQQWITDFMSQATANNLRVDEVAFHWYGSVDPANPVAAANSFLSRVDWYHDTFNRPVWVTEFGGIDWGNAYTTEEMQQANRVFLETAIAGLESRSFVTRYAWFPWRDDTSLMSVNSDGQLEPTLAGDSYIPTLQTGDIKNLNGNVSDSEYIYLRGGQLVNNGADLFNSNVARIHALNATDGGFASSTIGGSGDWRMQFGGTVQVNPNSVLRVQGTGTVHLRNINTLNEGTIRLFGDNGDTANLRISGADTITRGTGELRLDAGTNLFLGLSGDTTGFDLNWDTQLRGGQVTVYSPNIRLTGNGTLFQTSQFLLNSNFEISGDITGNNATYNLNKSGSGVLTMSGQNTFAGTLVIQSGDVILNGSVAGSGVTVNNTGRLRGVGVIHSDLTVQTGGVVAPGIGIGTLTADSADFRTGSDLTLSINSLTSFDRLIVNQNLSIASGARLTVTFGGGFNAQLGNQFDLVDFGSRTGNFLFQLPTLGSGLMWNTSSFVQTGVISVVAVPEPGTLLVLTLMGAMGLFQRRR